MSTLRARIGAAARGVLALLVVAAVVTTLAAAAPVPLLDFFGFFTVQGNLIGAAVAAAGAVRLLGGSPATTAWSVVRWCAATDLAVVGLVYWLVLAPLGAAGGVAVPWANLVLHGVAPAAAVLDWLLLRDRAPLPARLLPLVLLHPLVWTAVVLVRGATDGWVPYPFLSPAQGRPVVAAWVAVVAGAFAGTAALLRRSPPGRR